MKKISKTFALLMVMLIVFATGASPVLADDVDWDKDWDTLQWQVLPSLFGGESDLRTGRTNPQRPDTVIQNTYWADLEEAAVNTNLDETFYGVFPKYLVKPTETAIEERFRHGFHLRNFPVSGISPGNAAMEAGAYPDNTLIQFSYLQNKDIEAGSFEEGTDPISDKINVLGFKESDLLSRDEVHDTTLLKSTADIQSIGSTDSTEVGQYAPGDALNLEFTLNAPWFRRFINGYALQRGIRAVNDDTDFWTEDNLSQLYETRQMQYDAQLVYTLDLPDGIKADHPAVKMAGLNGFDLTTEIKDQKLIMSLRLDHLRLGSWKAMLDAVNANSPDHVTLSISGLSVDPAAEVGKQITMPATVSGFFDWVPSDPTIPRDPDEVEDGIYSYEASRQEYLYGVAQQSDAGRDAAAPQDKPKLISYSFQVVPPKPSTDPSTDPSQEPSTDPTTGGSEGQPSESSALRIIKVDGTGKAISAPVTFSLKNTNGIFQPRTATTNEHGIAELSTPMAGTYTLTEIKTPEGYIPLEKPMKVTIDSQGRASVDGNAPTKTLFIVNETVKPVNDPVAPITGDTRFDVAVNLSKTYFGDARKVIIVQDQAYADSMSAMNISQGQIPILYTKQNELSAVTREEILRTGRDELIVVGGPNTISPKVFNELQALKHGKVTRVGGADRFEVNVNSVKYMDHPTTAVIASGWIYTDALSSVPFAYQQKAPVVLVGTDSVPAVIREMLDKDYTDATLVGGPVTVSEKAEAELESILGTDIERIGGADRYAVSATVGARVGKTENAIVTSGELWSDALIAGPLAQKLPAPVLLTRAAGLSEPISATIAGNTALKRVIVIGGPVSIGGQVRADLRALLLPEEAPAQ